MDPQSKTKDFQVIIIGAGAAGIGAATRLSKQNLPYIVLEARDRVGGRLKTQMLDQVPVDLGGSWIHCYGKSNPLRKYVSQLIIQQTVFTKRQKGRIYMDGQEGCEFDKDTQQIACSNSSYFYMVVNKALVKCQKDLSLYEAAKQFLQGSVSKFNPKQRRCFDLMMNRLQHYQGSSIRQLSANYYEYSTDQGGDFTPCGGYGQFMKKISNKHKINISLKKIVKHIIYNQDRVIVQCEDGSTYTGKKLITSLPLGVLKSRKIKFTPELPKQYQQSIQKLGVGLMDKIVVSFQQNFWGSPYWISVGCNQRGKFSHIYNLSQKNKHILCCFITDDFARKTQNHQDQQIIRQFSDLLKKLFKKQDLKIKQYAITRWGKDQFSMGSYSSFHVGSTPQDSLQLRKPINNKVWLVGEHCYPQKIGTAHGAFKTGEMASQQVLKSLKWVNPIFKMPRTYQKVDKK